MCGFGKSLIPTYLSAEVAVVTTLDEVPGPTAEAARPGDKHVTQILLDYRLLEQNSLNFC